MTWKTISLNQKSYCLKRNGDKASRPNGFIVAFWQYSWDFVKEDLMKLFKEFHEMARFVKSLNSTFLS